MHTLVQQAMKEFLHKDKLFRSINRVSQPLDALKPLSSASLHPLISRYIVSACFMISLQDTWSPSACLLLIHSSKSSSSSALKGFLPPPVNFFLCFPLLVITRASISLFLDLHSRILFSCTRKKRDAGRLPCVSAYWMASFLTSRLYA